MRIFITGGSGFAGGHAIERLAQTHEVWAMARSDRSATKVAAYGARPVRCDLSTITEEQLAGVDVVVHAAAFVEEWGTRAQFWSANVDGTTRMLEAARGAGVSRFIHVGTEAALFDGRDLLDVDESHPYPERHRFLYPETKAEAERRVLAANGPELATLSIRPRFIWGPRDASVLPTLLEMNESGRFVWLDGGRAETSTTHVYNLVAAIERALSHGEGGRAYFVVDDDRGTYRAFLSGLTATQGVTLPERSLPGWLARGAARVIEGLWRVLGLKGTPPMTHYAIAMLSRTVTIDDRRARDELGYTPVIDWARGLAELKTERAMTPSDAQAASCQAAPVGANQLA